MRSKNPVKMKEIQEFAEDFYLSENRSPSTTEIAAAVSISRGTAYRYLVEMNDKGMIEYVGGEIRTPLIDRFDTETSGTPIVGSIPCGDPMDEVENIEQIVSLPTQIFGTGPLYILKASGDSMVDAGIGDGDYVVIRKTTEAHSGDIVVALDQNNRSTLKTFRGVNKKTKKFMLSYENQEKYKDKIIEVSELVVQGVAQHVIKEL